MPLYSNDSWLKEFEELMFGPAHTKETMELAAQIKLNYMPELLFKYRHCSEYTIQALECDFLYSSQPSLFNDIFEGPIQIERKNIEKSFCQETYRKLRKKYPFFIDEPVYSPEDLLDNISTSCKHLYSGGELLQPCNLLEEKLEKYIVSIMDEHIEELQAQAKNMYNICCLSAVNNSKLMWAHYADEHKGFCIGYDIKSLNNNLTQLTFPVIYRNSPPLIVSNIEMITSSACMQMLTQKSLDWEYEKEWRIFFPANESRRRENMPPAKVLYLGARISPNDANKLLEICNRKKISAYQIMPNSCEQKLVAIPI